MSRANARKVAMQLLYEQMYQSNISENDMVLAYEFADDNKNVCPNIDDKTYIENVLNGVVLYKTNIDDLIIKHLNEWTIDRLAKVDLAILRLSVFEMLYCQDIPNNVSISEAINLAQTYSDSKSARFINGVLGSISRDKFVKTVKK